MSLLIVILTSVVTSALIAKIIAVRKRKAVDNSEIHFSVENYNRASIYENAQIFNKASIYDDAKIYNDAE